MGCASSRRRTPARSSVRSPWHDARTFVPLFSGDLMHGPSLARHRSRGQSTVEFALVVPIMLIMLVAVVDLARLYTTMMSVESAAREAADYGSFYTHNWATSPVDNQSITLAEMERRA